MSAQPQQQLTDFERDILIWMAQGEKTYPAETIALTLLGVSRAEIFKKKLCIYAPCNSNEFRTCYLMVTSVPGAREQLDKLKTLGRMWTNVVENWDKLVKLYKDERLQAKQPKLDALLFDLSKRAVV